MHQNKIVIIVRGDLLGWQKLNVAAFLAASVAAGFAETHGRPFISASHTHYLPFIKQPILIYVAEDEGEMKRAFNRAKERELHIGIYTRPLFATRSEEENLQEIAKYTDEEQDLAGIVMYGENKKVDKAVKDLRLHP